MLERLIFIYMYAYLHESIYACVFKRLLFLLTCDGVGVGVKVVHGVPTEASRGH